MRIGGLLVVVPENESRYADELDNYNFPAANSRKLQNVIGIDRHRLVTEGTCASDLALFGLRHLIDRGALQSSTLQFKGMASGARVDHAGRARARKHC